MAFMRRRGSRRSTFTVDVPEGFDPSYKDPRSLRLFMTPKGKLLPRTKTTLSQRLQKKLAREVKRARQLAMLPYVTVFK